MSNPLVRSLGFRHFLGWVSLNVVGTAGGVLIFCDKRCLYLLDNMVGEFSMTCRYKNVDVGVIWVVARVYGPLNSIGREILWEELGAVRGLWEDPWCVGGNFNLVRFLCKRNDQGGLPILWHFKLVFLPIFFSELERKGPYLCGGNEGLRKGMKGLYVWRKGSLLLLKRCFLVGMGLLWVAKS